MSALKRTLKRAIKRGKEALARVAKRKFYDVHDIPSGCRFLERSYEMHSAASFFRQTEQLALGQMAKVPEEERIPLQGLIDEFEAVRKSVNDCRALNQVRTATVFFIIPAEKHSSDEEQRFEIGEYAKGILDLEAKDDEGNLLIHVGRFKFKGRSRIFPSPDSKRGCEVWKMIRALLATDDPEGWVHLGKGTPIPKPSSTMQSERNRKDGREGWGDHVEIKGEGPKHSVRGRAKKYYRFSPRWITKLIKESAAA